MQRSAIFAPIASSAELHPDAPALIEPRGAALSYREFSSAVAACRLRLEQAEISSEQVIAVLLPPSAMQVVAVAAAISHSVCAPLPPRLTLPQFTALLRSLSASVLIVSPELAAESAAAAAMGLTVISAAASERPNQWRPEWRINRSHTPPPKIESETVLSNAALILTTTSAGADLSHVSLSAVDIDARIVARKNSLRLTQSDRLLLMNSLSSSAALENAFAQLQCGGSVILTGGFDPRNFLEWLSNLKPTWYACAPAVHQAALLRLMHDPQKIPSSLRFVQSTGPLPIAVAQKLEAVLGIPIIAVNETPETGPNISPARFPVEPLAGNPPSPAEMTKHANDVFFYRTYEIWARILDRDDLGFDENFFDAGGDSQAAINMLAEVDKRFGSQTSSMAASFLDEPTLAHLVELVGKPALPRPGENTTSEIRVLPIREEGAAQRIFCIPADGDEGLYFQRLATHLRGQIDLSIVRPVNAWFSQSLFTIEHAGATIATLIRDVQREGPYLVSGYCYGGFVAAEAARQLAREGQDVRLVLFDVYMPAHPSLLRGWRTWVKSARVQWRACGEAGNENFALDPRYVMRRLGWSAVIALRRFIVPVEHVGVVQWLLCKVQWNKMPFYKAHPIKAPILHFLCAVEPNLIDREALIGWRSIASNGIVEQVLAFDHMNLFHESNLPKIVETLLRWSKQPQSSAEREILESSQSGIGA
jgi:thioesterase domain-containing protein